MSPVGNSSLVKEGRYYIVTWDLDTTGRRLIDEICQVAGFYKNGYEICHAPQEPPIQAPAGHSASKSRQWDDIECSKMLKLGEF